jgi:protein-L-isoaspartate(D-aspartate) O-methyltransferase
VTQAQDPIRAMRLSMVESQIRHRGIVDTRVLRAFEAVPRHLFVPEAELSWAYRDAPHSIGHRQTISQPYIVALMTEVLALGGGEKVLEIGTGCGYQTAILAEMGAVVHTVERIPELGLRARTTLEGIGYRDIRYHVGDGSLGWPEAGPFDRIIVTAGARTVPGSLQGQLADHGILVLPVGAIGVQELVSVRREGERFETESHCRCAFVKLIGEKGWPEEG